MECTEKSLEEGQGSLEVTDPFKELEKTPHAIRDQLDTFIESIAIVKKNYEQAVREKEDIQEKYHRLETEKEELKLRFEALIQEQADSASQKQEQNEMSAALLEEIQVLRREMDRLSESKNDLALEERGADLQEALQKNEALQEECNEYVQNIADLDNENQKLRSQVSKYVERMGEVEEWKKKYQEDKQRVLADVKTGRERIANLEQSLKKQEEQNVNLRKWMKNMERENSQLKVQAVALQKQQQQPGSPRDRSSSMDMTGAGEAAKAMSIGDGDIVVPEINFKDVRVSKPLQQLCQTMLKRNLISMVASSIGPECEQQLIVTCVPNKKEIDIDIRQALDALKLGLLRPIVVIFHHLASHRKFPLPSIKRIMDEKILKRSRGLIDIFYWNNIIYSCEQNAAAIRELEQMLDDRDYDQLQNCQP